MIKCIKVLLLLTLLIPHSGTHLLFSQSISPEITDSVSANSKNKLTDINKGRVLISPEESVEVDKSNLIPVRKKFQFSLISLLRGLLGIGVLIFLTFLLSERRRAVPWKVVGLGLLLQILLAIGILQVPFIQSVFEYGGKVFVKILDFTNEGTEFLFKSMVTGKIEAPLQTFAVKILPTIIFFSAITSVLFYFGKV